MTKGKAYTSGKCVNEKRGSLDLQSAVTQGYLLKCPYGRYFCTPSEGMKLGRGRFSKAGDYKRTLKTWEEVLKVYLVSQNRMGGKNVGLAHKTLSCVLCALDELSFYDRNDIIVCLSDLSSNCNDKVIFRCEIKNRMSSFRQKTNKNSNLSSPRKGFVRDTVIDSVA